ncbi:regulatory protein RecX [Naasia sp. SYSU D00948]|uniref:regulatory protein RecX n=1 Tax=Naasia sp. SYSU D00948 TaxID=2817379 RepID=UPI001B317625|nr:regulatory protein RecX [Naasia sp. SYSU D00948]
MPSRSDDADWVAPVVPLFRRDDRPAPPEEPVGEPSENHPARSAERRARRAQNVSVAALTRRGMSEAELRDTLAQRGIDEAEAEAEIARLTEGRYLDDLRLAEAVVRVETERKGKGRAAVVAELRRRRVTDSAIEEALDDFDDEEELRLAVSVAEKRARQLSGLDPETARRRLAGFLQRRGFSGSVMQHALRAALPRASANSVVFVESDD